jgi:hypothetical protein
MDYEFLLFMLIAFMIGRLSKNKFYIGSDIEKYKNADFAILLRKLLRK